MSESMDGDRDMQDVAPQLERSDTLDVGGPADPLDEGYSPPDWRPSIRVPTEAEEEAGESLDQRLAEEEPDIDPYADEFAVQDRYEVGARRAGRLVDLFDAGSGQPEDDLVASDAGIDGAGASAEEAAVHLIDEQDEEDEYPDGEPID